MSNKCLIIAEAGVNHNGNLDIALQLCNRAKDVGADIIKFQTWKTEKLLTKELSQADYQKTNTGIIESQFDMLKRLELSYQDFRIIKKHCDDIGIVFASTADEPESLDFLVELGIPFIKVGSGDIGNIPFLRYIGRKNMPVVLSTGMSGMEDVDISINALREGGAQDITILHCTTSYPCKYDDVNLMAMISLRDRFHVPVGYSDHTIGSIVPISAVAIGACIIEKHFTLSCKMQGPDHVASTEPKQFKEMVDAIRIVEKCLGDGVKTPSFSERKIASVISKRIVASREIEIGEQFTDENICVMRSCNGELARNWDLITGCVASKKYNMFEGIYL